MPLRDIVNTWLEIRERRGTLARLAVKCSGRRYHNDDSTFAVFPYRCSIGHVRETLADEVDSPSYVHIHDKIKTIKAKGIPIAVENLDVGSLSGYSSIRLGH